eukprot:832639_1
MSEEETYGTTQASKEAGDEDDYKSQLSGSDVIKLELLKGLIAKNVNLSDLELSELTGFSANKIRKMRQPKKKEDETPLTWDYVLAFDVGDDNADKDPKKMVKPKRKDLKLKKEDDNDDEWTMGMTQAKYFGQIFNNFWQRLEAAQLSVEAYKSAEDGDTGKSDTMFLIVGITESDLKTWASDRDTDLLIDPKGGVEVGREKDFALAKRTILTKLEQKEADRAKEDTETIDLSNWSYLYGEYSEFADERVYKHYKRLPPGVNDSLETVFDERTRLRIIYESIIADTNEGGAEIRIVDDLLNKKHLLKAVFRLDNSVQLQYVQKEWISIWSTKVYIFFGELVQLLERPSTVAIRARQADPLGRFVSEMVQKSDQRGFLNVVARGQFNDEWQHDKVTGLWVEEFSLFRRVCCASEICIFVSIWLSCCVVAVIFILLLRDKNPNDLLLKILLGVANAVMIFVFDAIYKVVSHYGNEWENHRTEQDFQNAMIYKSFCFKFVNSFASLFYLGFIRPGQNGLYYYVHFYDTVCASAAPFMGKFLSTYDTTRDDYEWFTDTKNIDPSSEFYEPCVTDGIAQACIDLVQDPEKNAAWEITTDGYYPLDGNTALCAAGSPSSGGSREIDGSKFDVDNGKCYGTCDSTQTQIDQNEVVLDELRIQLLTLFLTAIVIQNTLEVGIPLICQKIRDKKANQQANKQSLAEVESGKDRYENTIDDMSELIIQFGYVTLFVMAFPLTPLLAIVNNIIEMKVDGTNLVKTAQRPDPNGSYGLGSWNGVLGFFSVVAVATNVGLITWRTKLVTIVLADNPAAQWIFFSLLSIFLSIIVGVEKWVIPDVPLEVEQAIERQRLVESVLILGAGAFEVDKKPDTEDDEDAIPFDPSLEFIDVKTLPDVPFNLNQSNDQTA